MQLMERLVSQKPEVLIKFHCMAIFYSYHVAEYQRNRSDISVDRCFVCDESYTAYYQALTPALVATNLRQLKLLM